MLWKTDTAEFARAIAEFETARVRLLVQDCRTANPRMAPQAPDCEETQTLGAIMAQVKCPECDGKSGHWSTDDGYEEWDNSPAT